jgi:hypothetical protein
MWIVYGFISALLLVSFFFAFRYSELLPKVLVVLATGVVFGMAVFPRQSVSSVLMLGAGLAIPFQSFAVTVVGGEGIQWIHVFGIILITHFFIRFLMRGSVPVSPAAPWIGWLLASTFISMIGFIDQPDEHIIEFWKSEVQLFYGVLLFFAVSSLRLKTGNIVILLKALILLSVLIALFGLYQLPARLYGLPGAFLKFTNPSVAGLAQTFGYVFAFARASSVFSEPSYFGRYMVGILALSVTAYLHNPKMFGKVIYFQAILLAQIIGLVASLSMGAFYLAAEVAVAMLIFEPVFIKKKILKLLVALVAAAFAGIIIVDLVTEFPIITILYERVFGIYKFILGDSSYLVPGESVNFRVDSAMVALRVWEDHPIYGIGLGSYTLVSSRYGELNPFGYAANTIVNMLAESGIIGCVALLGFGLASIRGLWRVFKNKYVYSDPIVSDEMSRLQLCARMVFYMLGFEILYWHFGGSIFQPGLWFYFGLGALITVMYWRRMTLFDKSEAK